jgi:hypothetical protein
MTSFDTAISKNERASRSEQRWLLLIHQLPTKPAYFRVKIWRRLQGIGAVAVKSTVYALPANGETQEDFEWLLKEIIEGGGEAMVCEARLIDGLSDAQARALFDAARDEDYQAIAQETRGLSVKVDAATDPKDRAEWRAQARRLRKRLADIVAIDFFGATGRLARTRYFRASRACPARHLHPHPLAPSPSACLGFDQGLPGVSAKIGCVGRQEPISPGIRTSCRREAKRSTFTPGDRAPAGPWESIVRPGDDVLFQILARGDEMMSASV